MPQSPTGVVSVVLVNYRGALDTVEAVGHLRSMKWPENRLEIVVVDNASGDDSLEVLRAITPAVTIVESKENLGFAGGCNLGVRHSSGEYIGFLNNDAKPDPAWVRAAVDRFEGSARVGAVASRVLDWDGELVDYIGSAMTWFGMGYKPFTAQTVPSKYESPSRVLFGTGSAMFVRRTVFDELGGFDERYFMFFEDVDFGWRLNLRGHVFAYEPRSLAFHKHHASMASFGQFKEQYLLERNALFTLYKNLGSTALAEALPAALALSIRRGMSTSKADSTSFDLRTPGGDAQDQELTPKILLSSVYGIDQFVEELPSMMVSRDEIQATRVVADASIWRLFGTADAPVIQNEYFLEGYEKLVTAFDVAEEPVGTKILIITGDPIGAKLAGPAIRAFSIANALAVDHDVMLVSLSAVEAIDAPFEMRYVRSGDDKAFDPLEAWADVIIFQGHALAGFSALQRSAKIFVIDIYDPMHLEQLEQARELPFDVWTRQVADATAVLNQQLERGDFFMCASDRQKHFYLGQLAALGRITPTLYDGDPDLSQLISVVPFGLDRELPRHERAAAKGVIPGIGENDRLLLWSGGLYNWFDPMTLIDAVAIVAEDHPEVKLFFQGTKHPHPGVPEMQIVSQSRKRAHERGVLGRNVFFNESWVEYADRQNFLTEADIGVSTHHAHVETTFSFRTRILDYLWAGLPMVVTKGDVFAELVESRGLGRVVPDNDAPALAEAIVSILFDPEETALIRERVQVERQSFYWDKVLAPLVEFVADPHPAADRRHLSGGIAPTQRRRRVRQFGLKHDAGLVIFYLRNGGPQLVMRKIRSRLRRR